MDQILLTISGVAFFFKYPTCPQVENCEPGLKHIDDIKGIKRLPRDLINLQLVNITTENEVLKSSFIKDLHLKNLGIFGCKIGTIEENALTDITIDQGFHMENSTFQNIHSKAFNVNIIGQHKNGALVQLLDVRFVFLHSLAFHEVTTLFNWLHYEENFCLN